jgi:hypothetical protein
VYLIIDKNLSVNVCQFSMPYLCIEWSLLQANPRIHYLIDKQQGNFRGFLLFCRSILVENVVLVRDGLSLTKDAVNSILDLLLVTLLMKNITFVFVI